MYFIILIVDFFLFYDCFGMKKKDCIRKLLKNFCYIVFFFIFYLFGVEINKEKFEIWNC